MAYMVHFVIGHATPPVRQEYVIWSQEYVVHVQAQLLTVTSVTHHVVLHALTVNVTEMANVHQGVLSTTSVQDVSSCARKTALRHLTETDVTTRAVVCILVGGATGG